MEKTFEVYKQLILEKLERVREMYSLTLLWYKWLEEDKVEDVEKGINERGNIINRVRLIDEKLKQFEGLIMTERQKQEDIVVNNEIKRLKLEMAAADEKLKSLFEIKMEEVKKEIREVKMQKKRTISYGGLDYTVNSMYFNTKQ